MNSKILISLSLIALILVFVFQNTTVVEIQFFWWSLSMSRALMVFAVLIVGIVIGWLWGSHFMHKRPR